MRVTALLPRLSRWYAVTARLARRGTKALWWAASLQLPRRLRERRQAIANIARPRLAPAEVYAEWIRAYDTLDEADEEGMAALYEGLEERPLVSVLMPLSDAPVGLVRAAIESVRGQVYENWELCLAGATTSHARIRQLLEEYERADARVRVAQRVAGSVAAASNEALEIARGELVTLVRCTDLLRPHSLLLSTLPFRGAPQVGLVYTDSDCLDESGRRVSHCFEPDWNPALLLCQDYVGRLSVVRTDLVRVAGGYRPEFEGSHEWDLAFRVTERLPAGGIVHVPHVLYHSRPAVSQGRGRPAADAARRAVEEHLRRTGRRGEVVPVGDDQTVRFLVGSPKPPVSVVVPSTGRRDLLEPCIEGLLSKTSYGDLEVVVAVDETAGEDPSRRPFLAELASRPRVRIATYPSRPFNYALTVNEAVAQTETRLVLLLNDDVEIVREDWLEAMVGYADGERVGAVGGLLVYPDGTIHSAGMLVGARSVAENRYHRRPAGISGYANRARLPQDVSAVVGACMLVTRDAFDEVGGLDVSFPVAYNDVDFCLKLRRAGRRIVYVPDAMVVHRGSASFETHQHGRREEHVRDERRMQERWGPVLLDDPLHNPNLELDASDPSRPASPPRVTYPWRRPSRTPGAR